MAAPTIGSLPIRLAWHTSDLLVTLKGKSRYSVLTNPGILACSGHFVALGVKHTPVECPCSITCSQRCKS